MAVYIIIIMRVLWVPCSLDTAPPLNKKLNGLYFQDSGNWIAASRAITPCSVIDAACTFWEVMGAIHAYFFVGLRICYGFGNIYPVHSATTLNLLIKR
jgi:hypothetical protein